MFSYISLGTNDMARSARFYDAVMGALGHGRCEPQLDDASAEWIGWGQYQNSGRVQLALWVCRPFDGRPASSGNGTMIALRAQDWEQVDAFHAAALSTGGSSEGAPGLRLGYAPDFYAAYVRDPDGNKLAAVCRGFTTRPMPSRKGGASETWHFAQSHPPRHRAVSWFPGALLLFLPFGHSAMPRRSGELGP